MKRNQPMKLIFPLSYLLVSAANDGEVLESAKNISTPCHNLYERLDRELQRFRTKKEWC